MAEGGIVNRVAKSGIVTLDLGEWYPEGDRHVIDLVNQLWQGLVLKEADFRAWLTTHDWSAYQDAHVAVHCSADAIVPHWAYMLVQTQLTGVANTVVFGDAAALENQLWSNRFAALNPQDYQDTRIVIKGCADREVVPSAFMLLVQHLQPVAKSIMYGEPCSTVPVYKRPKGA